MTLIIAILTLHYIADFLCQSDWIATNKSHDLKALTLHVVLYTLVMLVGLLLLATVEWFSNIGLYALQMGVTWRQLLTNGDLVGDSVKVAGWIFMFVVANGFLHLVTDLFTSKATTALYTRGKRHWFFCMIGFDQLIHQVTLLATAGYFLRGWT